MGVLCSSTAAYAQDVGVASVQRPVQNACGISQQPLVIEIENFGATSASNIPVSATITGTPNAILTATIAGPVGGGQTVTATIGNFDTFEGGTYTVNATTNLPGDTVAGNDALQATLTIDPGRVAIANEGPRCPGSPATLMTAMPAGAQYEWYDVETGGTALGQGASFTTPPLTSNTSYWVQRVNNLSTAGLPDNSGWTGGNLDPNICNTNGYYGPQFNVSRPVTLTSVTIYPAAAGSVTIRLLSAVDSTCGTSNVLQTATANASGAGAMTVQLNFPLSVGNGYVLDAAGTTVDLFRINAFQPQGYPLQSSDGSITITGQTFNFTDQYYYWFFNWQLGSEGCDDERTEVPVTLDPSVCLADIDLQTDGPPTTFRGGSVTIDSTVDNLGPDLAREVTLTATAPAGLVFQSNAGACTTALPCALGDQPVGPAREVATTWSVPANYSGTNNMTFSVAATNLETDPDTTNNSRSVNVLLVEPVDTSVQVTSATIAPGGVPYDYDVTVGNTGPGIAVDSVLSLPLDPLFSSAQTSGCINDPNGVPLCDLGNIAINTTRTVRVTASSGATTTGTGTISASIDSISPETDTTNDTVNRGFELVLFTDYDLQATVRPNPVAPGVESVVFDLDVTNNGPSASNGFVVMSALSPELTGATTTGCDEDPGGVPTCTVSDVLASGASATIEIETQLAPDVLGSGQADFSLMTSDIDGDPTNNVRNLTLDYAPQADLDMSILPPTTEIVAGQTVEYRVRAFNLGPSLARNVQFQIGVPAELLGAQTSGCEEDPAGVPNCTIGDVAPNQQNRTFTLSATVSAASVGDFTTTFDIAADTADQQPMNNQEVVTLTTVERSEIRPTLMTDRDSVVAGREIEFTLTIEAGPSDARDVVADFTLPNELQLVSTTGCSSNTSPNCRVGVASGSEPTVVTLSALADEVTAPTQVEVSVTVETTTEGNDPSDDTVTKSIEVLPPTDVDLFVRMSVAPEQAMPGDTVAVIATVRNRGPGKAQDVTLELTLPSAVTLISSEGCREDPLPDSTCNIGEVLANSGDMARFELELADDASGPQTFVATVISSSGDEIGPGDESAEATVTLPMVEPDAGVVDMGTGGGSGGDDDGGCSCSAQAPTRGHPLAGMLALVVLGLLWRRRR